ncbi:unnamed protein product [Ranitomeya imitator]|uniref:Bicarbonate transporter-like transmembrane domain-containing protein n=1 Tax=Ranitomeya imitator TaxID=111125 RepID=A0ABN9KQE1_9NEOB|nr:unnamed protein product [Ranitomeya imitator]
MTQPSHDSCDVWQYVGNVSLWKGCGYHLDLLMVGLMLGICSIMGLPWFVAATVLSITHVNSLKLESECSAPGEQPKFLGIREQRVTGLMIFVLMGCSVFMTTVLKFIPMPVLYGVFLYMGVSSLRGIQDAFFPHRLVLTTDRDVWPYVASVVNWMRRVLADRRHEKTFNVTFFRTTCPPFPTAHARPELPPPPPRDIEWAADALKNCIRCPRCAEFAQRHESSNDLKHTSRSDKVLSEHACVISECRRSCSSLAQGKFIVLKLRSAQFFDRLLLFAMPAKHQPDFIYLRHVPLRKVHLFTIIQLTCLVLLWVIKASPAAIVFPMMVLALVFVRKVMDFCFTNRELSWLDDLMPESKKKKLEDAKNKAKELEEAEKMLQASDDKGVQLPLETRKLLGSPGKNNNSRCDPSDINISDEMPKTTVWKALSMNTESSKSKERSIFK